MFEDAFKVNNDSFSAIINPDVIKKARNFISIDLSKLSLFF